MTSKTGSGYNSPNTVSAAEALVALLNTRPHAGQSDSLADRETADNVLSRFREDRERSTSTELGDITQLRDALAVTLSDDPDAAAKAWSDVSRLVSSATVRRVFTPAQVMLEPAAGDAIIGGIAKAIQEVVEADSWSRLRVCPNHLCELAFYDSTRSRTQKWDSYETCGNRANVSAYRARLSQRADA